MNALQGPLRDVVELGGARCVALIAMDGVPVAAEGRAEAREVDLLAASYADLARRVARAGDECGLAPTEELVVGTADGWLALRVVTPDYGILALVAGDAILGRARHEMHKAALALRGELSG